MGQLKLMSAIMSSMKSEEDVDAAQMLLVVDPQKVTHYINFWRQESRETGITEERKAICEKMITMMLDYAVRQCTFTCETVYGYTEETEIKNEIEDKKADIDSNKVVKNATEDPSKVVLKVTAKNGEDVIPADVDRLLREKYKSLIKQVNVDGLKALVKIAYKDNDEAKAIEMANFILGKGLYLGKKCKNWPQAEIDKLVASCKVEPVNGTSNKKDDKPTTDVVTPTTDTNAPDTDLHKKYVQYLGEHAPTILGLRAQTKFDLSNGKVDDAMELATFMLSEGLCNDSEGKKWSNTEIENWFKEIKEDMVKNPLTKNEEPVIDVSKIDTSEDKEKGKKVKTYDVPLTDLYADIKTQVLVNNLSEEDIKKYIINKVKTTKVELVERFNNGTPKEEDVEEMYVKYFLSFVATVFKTKEVQAIDAKAIIAASIKNLIEAGDKTLGKAMAKAIATYKEKGEVVPAKEIRELVYAIANENHPEWYGVMMANAAKDNKDSKVNVVADKIDFPTKYPEAWNSIKDVNPQSLEDVFTMAKNLEATQAFPIVSAAIIYFLSTGKIKDKEGKDVKWENPQIEMWINTQFAKEETPAEKEAREKLEHPTPPATELPETKPGAGQETVENVPTTKVEPEVVQPSKEEQPAGNSTPSKETVTPDNPGEDTAATEKEKSDGKAASTGKSSEVNEFAHLGSYIIPKDHEPFKALYHKKMVDFEQGLVDIITTMMTAGKSKKDIKHDIADVLKAIAINDAITQTIARNWRKTSMEDLYKTIESKAKKLEIKGWAELKDE